MTSNEILKADVLDILFDNRNKQYGAYALRKNYNRRLGIALGISLSTILFVFFLVKIDSSPKFERLNHDSEVLVKTIHIPKEEKKLILPPTKKFPVNEFRQKEFIKMVIVDKENVEPLADIRDLDSSDISNRTVNGPTLTGAMPVINEQVVSVERETKTIAKEAPVQREPEFPGGQEAWISFLRKNLNSPQELEPGDKKMVSIRFQVSPEGTVTNFEIIQSAGKVFDNEVIRVLKKMPKWKPAIQNGEPVARAFSQPVTFVGIEQ